MDLEHRLQTYAATTRQRAVAHWQIYAAVTGSALAMATGTSAAQIRGEAETTAMEPAASARAVNQHLASSRNIPLANLVRAARAADRAHANSANAAGAPSISAGGIVPLYSKASVIQAGEWISIYGANLAAQTTLWNNDFPTSLGGVTVTINNKPAYLLFVSPNQINLQAPDDTATGTVPVVVTTPAGAATATVTLSQYAPSFSLLDNQHVSGIILRADNSGTYGAGAYDVLGPPATIGARTMPARAGDSVVLFGIGFGPTTPFVPAGHVYSGAAPTTDTLHLYIGNAIVNTMFVGLSSAGLYQINLKIPAGLGKGDIPLHAIIGGAQTPADVFIPLDDSPASSGGGASGTVVPVVSSRPGFFSTVPPPSYFPVGSYPMGGGNTGVAPPPAGTTFNSGGNSNNTNAKHAPYTPKLKFPPRTN